MSKHTPGPWEVNLDTAEIWCGELLIGEAYTGESFEDGDGPQISMDECQANARLMTASPDLLSAAERVLAAFGEMMVNDEQARALVELREVVKVAKGEVS